MIRLRDRLRDPYCREDNIGSVTDFTGTYDAFLNIVPRPKGNGWRVPPPGRVVTPSESAPRRVPQSDRRNGKFAGLTKIAR